MARPFPGSFTQVPYFFHTSKVNRCIAALTYSLHIKFYKADEQCVAIFPEMQLLHKISSSVRHMVFFSLEDIPLSILVFLSDLCVNVILSCLFLILL